jgi:hypothetical protein
MTIVRAKFLIALTAVVLCGCHSACFQTARIRDGVDAGIGVTRVRGADDPDVSDYSILVRGEVGWAARRNRVGYSLGLTFISPFETRGRDIMGADEPDLGSFPNQWAGALPEFKLQAPRNLPVDVALDVRFNAIYPERIGILASREITGRLAAYGSYFLNVDLGQIAVAGGEVKLTDTVSLMAEYSLWLSEHDYPNDYRGGRRKEPYSFGLSVSYHLPRTGKPYNPRPYAGNTNTRPLSVRSPHPHHTWPWKSRSMPGFDGFGESECEFPSGHPELRRTWLMVRKSVLSENSIVSPFRGGGAL